MIGSPVAPAMRKMWMIPLLILAVTGHAWAQSLADLRSELEAGTVQLVSVSGNGSSSGTALNGVLLNRTSETRQIAVNLPAPLFLRNRGQGQNMLVTQVYMQEGDELVWYTGSPENYIELQPNQSIPVSFNAYCIDFEKENPTESESFDVDNLPVHIMAIAEQMAAEERRNSELSRESNITAMQLVLWHGQGIAFSDIREKFDFDSNDIAEAARILSRR